MGCGKDGFGASPPENKNGIIRKWKAKNKHVVLGPQDGVETDPILWLSVRVPRIPGGARNEEIYLKRQTRMLCKMQRVKLLRLSGGGRASVWRGMSDHCLLAYLEG